MSIRRFPQLAHWGAYTAVVEDGRLIACEPFATDPHPSPMLQSIPSMVYSSVRIRKPAVRKGWLERRERSDGSLRGREDFVEVDWDTALDLVAGEMKRVRGAYGDTSVFGGSYGWSSAGRLHHARTLVRRYLFAGGGCVDQIGNYSWGAAQFFLPHVIGTFEPISGKNTHWSSIAKHTQLFVAFGGLALKNGQVTPGGSADHNMETWLRRCRDGGCQFVVVSPTRADAPAFLKPTWIPIRPNTDTALMLAIAHVLVTGNLHDRAFLASHATGFEKFLPYVLGQTDGVPKTPGWQEEITGVPAATVVELARRMSAGRTMLSSAWSLQRAHHGEQPYWGLITLAAMLGQIGLPGGGFGFGHGSAGGIASPRYEVSAPEMSMGKNPTARVIPVARIADMLLHPNEQYEFNGKRETFPDIRLVYWAGGNPYHHHQDLNRLRQAWARPQTIVVHDSWWTATARRADIVLPATTTLERNDVGGSSRDRYVIAMHRAIDPIGHARNDFDIFAELAARAGFRSAFTEDRDEVTWLRTIYGRARDANAAAGIAFPEFDEFWARGYAEQPMPDKDFVLFDDFRADPQAHPLKTPSGKIEIYSERIASFGYSDCPPHATWLAPREWLGDAQVKKHPLHLVTIQPPDRLHAQLDPGVVAKSHKVAGREKIRIHPDDARPRGITSGDVVRIFNDRGACLGGAEIDTGVIPGVVVMATGAWFDPDEKLGLDRHGNPNVLSFDQGTSRLAQGSSALSVLVQVERWALEAPPVQVHEPPVSVA